ncbi:dynein light chain Tctex-type protein 2B [Ambystoma mexicanum]|uniref:dynein light chain Tctex-type protein 2B n=1 Tax=Ambystoma mexicanum TaxID=8296 RepID=UPI0037E71D46
MGEPEAEMPPSASASASTSAQAPAPPQAPVVENTYCIRPNYQHKFRPSTVKEMIHAILKAELANKMYNPDDVPQMTKSLSESIKNKLKDMGYDRYKMVVQVVIGEQRGEGVKMAARCFWDADTDSYAQDVFMNDSLFCVAAAFGCFFY